MAVFGGLRNIYGALVYKQNSFKSPQGSQRTLVHYSINYKVDGPIVIITLT